MIIDYSDVFAASGYTLSEVQSFSPNDQIKCLTKLYADTQGSDKRTALTLAVTNEFDTHIVDLFLDNQEYVDAGLCEPWMYELDRDKARDDTNNDDQSKG